MPSYDYVCQDCATSFEIRMSISEYSKGLTPRCPDCGCERVIRKFTPINIATGTGGRGAPSGGCAPGSQPGCCA